jgi:hypothetical protein
LVSFFSRLRTPGDAPPIRSRERTAASWALTALAAVVVGAALVLPNRISQLQFESFARIPIEAIVGLAVLLVLPPRARRVAATAAGIALSLLVIIKITDMGFYYVLSRPFDLVLDWILFPAGYDALADSIGQLGAVGVLVGTILLIAAILVSLTLSVRRLAELTARYRRASAGVTGVAAAAWLGLFALGAQLVPDLPVADRGSATIAYDRAVQVRAGIQDQREFTAQAGVDAYHDTAGEQMLTALRGNDVVFGIVESYGRSAVENPTITAQVDPALADGDRRLAAAGYSARSGYLTSPVSGSGSWLAHATLFSGLKVNNQQRYRTLTSSDRLTLTKAFQRSGHRTVTVMAGTETAWPEDGFYGIDKVYDSRNLGYKGSRFSWSPMPDQYIMSAFQRLEYGTPGRGPLMAEIPLVSSHWPWAPIPSMVDWDSVGDGSQFTAMAKAGNTPESVWDNDDKVRAEYGKSIAYSLESLFQYVQRYGRDNLVLVILGDHQPSPVVTGDHAGRDVPITIVAKDRAVLDRISDWGWTAGLKPDPKAPVWPMEAFRDRFLSAYGSQAATSRAAARPNR